MVVLKILFSTLLIAFVSLLALLFQGLDRIGHARMQRRVGPPLSQPVYDFLKLLGKENITPRCAVSWLFNTAPVLSVTSALLAFLFIPMGQAGAVLNYQGDVILVLYLITLSAAAMVMGAFASGSPIANIGAQRELVLMMSFEVPLAMTVSTLAWLMHNKVDNIASNVFSLTTYSAYSVWSIVGWAGVLGLICLFVAVMLVIPAESGTGLMDIAEAKTEILEGITVEYSGVNLALVNLSVSLRTLAVSALITAYFIPWSVGGVMINVLWFWGKTLFVALVGVTYLRTAFGRLKIWQAARFYWAGAGVFALAGMLLITVEVAMFQ